MLEPAIDWAQANGPPNWVFVVALLTHPAVWTKHIYNAARDLYRQRFGD